MSSIAKSFCPGTCGCCGSYIATMPKAALPEEKLVFTYAFTLKDEIYSIYVAPPEFGGGIFVGKDSNPDVYYMAYLNGTHVCLASEFCRS